MTVLTVSYLCNLGSDAITTYVQCSMGLGPVLTFHHGIRTAETTQIEVKLIMEHITKSDTLQ